MRNTLKKGDINLKLSADENKQKVETDVLVDYLKGLETRMEHIIAKTI
jgi:hypothetical protein